MGRFPRLRLLFSRPRRSVRFTCPRRVEVGREHEVDQDQWLERNAGRGCSWCGSMDPEWFLIAIAAGAQLCATDKNYKLYVDPGHRKFYTPHLSEAQGRVFYRLYLDKALTWSWPLYRSLYVPGVSGLSDLELLNLGLGPRP